MADVGHLEFSRFRVYVMWTLSSCYTASLCKISLQSDNQLLSYLQKRFIFKMAAIRHLEFLKNFIFDHLSVTMIQLTKFHRNRIIFRWDMAISRFSRWRISAILNFRGPMMGSLKSPFRTSYMLSIDAIALNSSVFEKMAFLCKAFGDSRQTNERTDGQHRCVKAPLAVASGALIMHTDLMSH